MNEVDVKKHRALLMAKRDEVLRASRRPEDIWIVQSNEAIETMQIADEREFAVRTLEREAKVLAQIDAALERISHGEFGTCIECAEPISPKRLAALPWAAYCLRCQELHDLQDVRGEAGPRAA